MELASCLPLPPALRPSVGVPVLGLFLHGLDLQVPRSKLFLEVAPKATGSLPPKPKTLDPKSPSADSD